MTVGEYANGRWSPPWWVGHLITLSIAALSVVVTITSMSERITVHAGRISGVEQRVTAIESAFSDMRIVDTTQSNAIAQLADMQFRLRAIELSLPRIEGTMAAGFERQKNSLDRFLQSLQGVREDVAETKKQLTELAERARSQVPPRGRE